MIDSMDISEVAKRTGLSPRALRFYEARGLVKPLRWESGRRYFNTASLERLHEIVLLKSAGLTLSQMQRLFDGKPFDLGRMIRVQIALLEADAARVDMARILLLSVLSRIDSGEPVDAATFCSLIESGDNLMSQKQENWKKVTDQYFTPEEKKRWAQSLDKLPASFDQEAYQQKWFDLGQRIAKALPLEPDSKTAQSFLDEWYDLLKPFASVAKPEMWNSAVAMYDDMDNWRGGPQAEAPDPGFGSEVWEFCESRHCGPTCGGGQRRPDGT